MGQATHDESLGPHAGPHSSAAGRSARAIADGAEAAAEVLERKAAYARSRAASFRQGAQGEQNTAAALAELSQDGWVVLHDRLAPGGGNIDHLLVGPGGLVLVDSKSWSGAVTVDGGELKVGARHKSAEVAAVAALAASMERAVEGVDSATPIRSVLSLVQEAPPNGAVRLSAGPVAVGVEQLAALIRQLPRVATAAQVDALAAAALGAFPTAARTFDEALDTPSSDHTGSSELFLRATIFLYVEPWTRSGHRRLYLNDVQGASLGFKDLVSGEIKVSVSEETKVVNAVLANAHAGGLSLSRSSLPKVPVRVPGGRLLGHLGRLWCSYLIAQHWRRGGKDRLYVTHVVMDQGIFELGHVDLATGLMHPSSNEPLGKDLREPRRYLERAAERYPRR